MNMIQSIAKHTFTPLLKPLGFSTKGLVWNRRRGEFVDVITLQKLCGSASEAQRLTVNIGVAAPELYQVIFEKARVTYIEADCVVRVRPGELEANNFGYALDKSWSVNEQNVESCIEEISFFISDKAIPFVESYNGYGALSCHLEKLEGWQVKYPYIQILRAMMFWKLGDSIRCEEILSSKVASKWPEKVTNVRRWIQESS